METYNQRGNICSGAIFAILRIRFYDNFWLLVAVAPSPCANKSVSILIFAFKSALLCSSMAEEVL